MTIKLMSILFATILKETVLFERVQLDKFQFDEHCVGVLVGAASSRPCREVFRMRIGFG